MKLTRAARAQLVELITNAAPLNGTFFRSVAFRYFHPEDLISGEGTRQYGGRFVPVGVRAVYASAEEETVPFELEKHQSADSGGSSTVNLGDAPPKVKSSSGVDAVAEALESGVNIEDAAHAGAAKGAPSVEFDELLAEDSGRSHGEKGPSKKGSKAKAQASAPTDEDME